MSTELVPARAKPKAIEPDAFTSPSHEARRKERPDLGWTQQILKGQDLMTKIEVPKWNPDANARAHGYTRNPAICGHEKKRMNTAKMTFWCADCGEDLPNG